MMFSIPWTNRKMTSAQLWMICLIIINVAIFLKAWRFYGSHIGGYDGQMYYAYVRSWVIDGDLDFKNEFYSLTPRRSHIPVFDLTPTGLVPNKYPIGFGLISFPFFVLAHFLTLAGSHWNSILLKPNGYSVLYDLLVHFGHLICGMAGIFFSYKFLRKYFEEKWTILAVTAVWFSTCLVYYGTVFLTMAHISGFFTISALYYLCSQLRWQSRWHVFLAIGGLAGLSLVLRPTNIVLLVFPAYLFFVLLFSAKDCRLRQCVGKMFLCLCAFCTIIALQMMAWKILYGTYICYSYDSEGFFFRNPKIFQILYSDNHGLFSSFPITWLCLVGLALAALKERKVEILLFSLSMVLLIYVNASWHCWWFGDSFGARAFTEAGLIFCFGLAYFMQNMVKRFSRGVVLCGILTLWNFYMMAVYVTTQYR